MIGALSLLLGNPLSVTTEAPHIRSTWNVERIVWMFMIALLPPLALALGRIGPSALLGIGVALLVAIGWQSVFARIRQRRFVPTGVIVALIVIIVLPPAAPLWQVALAVSFGMTFGELVFGGYGWNIINPAAVALAFLIFSFPNGNYAQGSTVGWAACLPGALLLIATGIVSWRVIVAAALAAIAILFLSDNAEGLQALWTGSFLFGLVFLAGDPVCAAATNLGRWGYGSLIGALVALGLSTGQGSLGDIVFACLLGSIFAPLIDQGVVSFNVQRRRRRYERT